MNRSEIRKFLKSLNSSDLGFKSIKYFLQFWLNPDLWIRILFQIQNLRIRNLADPMDLDLDLDPKHCFFLSKIDM